MRNQRNHSLADLERALRLHQAGRLQEAEVLYKKMPHNPDALHLRGVIAHQLNQNDQAIELINKAVRAQPSNPAYYYSLDTAYRALGRLDEVTAGYQRLLEHTPENAIAWNRLGNAIKDQGMPAEAVTCYQNAIALKPDFSEAFNNLGIVFAEHDELESAIDCYNRALALDPADATTHANLGIVFRKQRKLDQAEECYRKAIALKPDFAAAQTNLGNVLQEQNKLEEAVACFRRALALQPADAVLLLNLGNGLMELEKLDEATNCFENALALKPDFPEAHAQSGACLARKGNPVEAAARFLKAIELKPDFPEAFNELGLLFSNDTKGVLAHLGKSEQAIVCYRHALTLKPDLASAHSNLGLSLQAQGKTEEAIACYRNALACEPDFAAGYNNLLYAMLNSQAYTPEEVFTEHLRFAERFETPHKASWPAHANPRDKDKRLKVGYVSGDFRNHSIAFFFEPVLLGHDKSQVEVFCYHNHHQHDDVSSRLAALADHWIACKGMADEALAARIRADGIDILVDLSGHTAYNRLLTFARKPAPVQITWMGYPNSTGLSAIDYRLTDAAMDPPGLTERYNSETLLRLPTSCQFNPSPIRPPINALPALTQGVFTFACLNHLTKISEQAMALWAQILQALPDARLMLGGVNDQASRQKLIDTFARYGIAEDRLALHPKMSLDAFLALHHQIDLALDPFPFNGGTTSFHALSMGVPVVTLAGDTPVTRSGASIMANVGLPEFVATSPEEYVRLAIGFAGDVPRLDRIRQSLGAGNPALYEPGTNPFARHLEQAFRQVWTTWCDAPVNSVA
jgi:protein O-GlcNAc transferase